MTAFRRLAVAALVSGALALTSCGQGVPTAGAPDVAAGTPDWTRQPFVALLMHETFGDGTLLARSVVLVAAPDLQKQWVEISWGGTTESAEESGLAGHAPFGSYRVFDNGQLQEGVGAPEPIVVAIDGDHVPSWWAQSPTRARQARGDSSGRQANAWATAESPDVVVRDPSGQPHLAVSFADGSPVELVRFVVLPDLDAGRMFAAVSTAAIGGDIGALRDVDQQVVEALRVKDDGSPPEGLIGEAPDRYGQYLADTIEADAVSLMRGLTVDGGRAVDVERIAQYHRRLAGATSESRSGAP